MGNALKTRLRAVERRADTSGALPLVVSLPPADPERAAVLADIERRRAAGVSIVAIEVGMDPLAALVEVCI